MKTVGGMLREARERKKLTYHQIEEAIKIRAKFLESIEHDDWTGLPSLAYAKGFIKNYSNFLGLESEMVLAFFRRQTEEIPKSSLLPKEVSKTLGDSRFRLTPGKFLGLILVALVGVFFLYFIVQYKKLQEPPDISIDSPKEHTVTSDRRIDLFGSTDSDATVTVNGVSVIVRTDGRFFDQIALSPGVNKISLTATSRYGKSKTIFFEIASQQESNTH